MSKQLHKAWKQLFKQYAYWLNVTKLNDEFLGTFRFGPSLCEVLFPRHLFRQRLLTTIQDIVLVGKAIGPRHLQTALNLMSHTNYPSRYSEIMHMLTSKGGELSSYNSNEWADLRDNLFGPDYKDIKYVSFFDKEPAGISYSLVMLDYRRILLDQIAQGLFNLGIDDPLFKEHLMQMFHCALAPYYEYPSAQTDCAAFLLSYHKWSGTRCKKIERYLTSKL
jgi:hypothetical protein